jgi:LysM repeat protein
VIPIPIGYDRVQEERRRIVQTLVSRETHANGSGRFSTGSTTVEIFEIREVGSDDTDHYGNGVNGGAPLFAATASVIHRKYRKHTVTRTHIGPPTDKWEDLDAPPVSFLASTLRLWQGHPEVTRAAAGQWDKVVAKLDAAAQAVIAARAYAGVDWGGTNGAKFDRKCALEIDLLHQLGAAARQQADMLRQLADLQQKVDDEIRDLLIDLGIEVAATAVLAVVTLGLDIAAGAAAVAATSLARAASVARLLETMARIMEDAARAWRAFVEAHRLLATAGIGAAAKIGMGIALDPGGYKAEDAALDVAGSLLAAGIPEEKIAEVLAFMRKVHVSPHIVALVLHAELDDAPANLRGVLSEDTRQKAITSALLDAVTAGVGSKMAAKFEQLLERRIEEKFLAQHDRMFRAALIMALLEHPNARYISVRVRSQMVYRHDRLVEEPASQISDFIMGGANVALTTGADGALTHGRSLLEGGAPGAGSNQGPTLPDSLAAAGLADVLPTPPAVPIPPYVVQPGDTLPSIAERIYGSSADWVKLYHANGLHDANHIYPGDRLVVP